MWPNISKVVERCLQAAATADIDGDLEKFTTTGEGFYREPRKRTNSL